MKTKCRIITLLLFLMVTVLFIYHKNEYEGFEGVVDDAKEAAATEVKYAKIKKCADASKIVAIKCIKNQEFKKYRDACEEARGIMLNTCIDEEQEKDVPCKKSKKSKDETDADADADEDADVDEDAE